MDHKPGDLSTHRALVLAIRTGDVAAVRQLITRGPDLLQARIHGGRTALHVVADWPGYFPNGPQIVALLTAAGADANASGSPDKPDETPLHWAASSDDVEVAGALLDAGADIEAQAGSIAGGSPLNNAIGYGCWNVAQLLLTRGARVDRSWVASALGITDRAQELLGDQPTSDELNQCFWHACHGGQLRTAQHLLALGADPDAHPDYTNDSPFTAATSPGTGRTALADWLTEQLAGERPDATQKTGECR